MSATWDEFERLDLRVGVVTEVEEFPEARVPAYKLTIDFGSEIGMKRSSAQATHYAKDELLGRQVVCVLGFPVKRIAGVPLRGARARRVQRRARRGPAEARPGCRAWFHHRLNRASYLFDQRRPVEAVWDGLWAWKGPVLRLVGVQIASEKRSNPWTSLLSRRSSTRTIS
jgi:export-related chaperone CsaA